MDNIKIATAQFEHRNGDKLYNLSMIRQLSAAAKERGAEVVAFHECSITGYSFARRLSKQELLDVAEPIPDGPSIQQLIMIAREYDVAILAGLFEKDEDDNIYKAYVCVDKTGLVAAYRKIHPFISPYITPGNKYVVFDLYGWKCGILICYDNNVIENVRATALLGADIIFMPHVTMCTPSPRPGAGFVDPVLWENRHTDPTSLRQEFDGLKGRSWLMKWLPARAYDNGIYAVFANAIGMDDDQLKNGCSMILDPFGDILTECRSLGNEITVAVLTRDKLEKSGGYRYRKARKPELYKDILGQSNLSDQKVAWLGKNLLCLAVGLMSFLSAWCQNAAIGKVDDWRSRNEQVIITQFISFLTIPNVAADSVNIARNAAFIEKMMEDRMISHVQLLTGKEPGHPAAIYGEVLVAGAKETLGFYAHYDGQPVNPAQWARGLSPFTPVLFDGSLLAGGKPMNLPAKGPYDPQWRIYARGASDDKAGVMAILTAYQALTAGGIKPTCNIKFLFEGEEEAGSIHLGDIFATHSDLLQADCWVICDGPVHQTGRKMIAYGVRGDTHLDLTVYGPKRPLHSGHYGNWANNPAMLLVRLLASMKNDSGRVTIPGFYDDVQPLSTIEAKALAAVPSVDEQMKKELGVASTDMKGKSLSEAINLPSLNINGIQSGNVGAQASNQIPTYATAAVDLRLVLGNDWQRQQQKVTDHIRAQGFTVLDHDPTDSERLSYPLLIKVVAPSGSYNAQRTAMDLPVVDKIRAAVQTTVSYPLVLQPTSGGSLPLYLFEKYLHTHTITIPLANYDNNQHAENENIRIQNLWDGIESMAAIMTN